MVKLALVLLMGTVFAQGIASTSQPPLLIEDTTAAHR